MSWNKKYIEFIERIFWTPKYIGLKPIGTVKDLNIDAGAKLKLTEADSKKSLYVRRENIDALKQRLPHWEEILNEAFNFTFAIAPDAIISRLFFKQIGFSDTGPFSSLSIRDVARILGWGEKNVTQHDGLFISNASILNIELKIAAKSSSDQILKYLCLTSELAKQNPNIKNFGLLFIAPKQDGNSFWTKCDLEGPAIDKGFLKRALERKHNKFVKDILNTNAASVENIAARMKIKFLSWNDLLFEIEKIVSELNHDHIGDQTLIRLLDGFRNQLKWHEGAVP